MRYSRPMIFTSLLLTMPRQYKLLLSWKTHKKKRGQNAEKEKEPRGGYLYQKPNVQTSCTHIDRNQYYWISDIKIVSTFHGQIQPGNVKTGLIWTTGEIKKSVPNAFFLFFLKKFQKCGLAQ